MCDERAQNEIKLNKYVRVVQNQRSYPGDRSAVWNTVCLEDPIKALKIIMRCLRKQNLSKYWLLLSAVFQIYAVASISMVAALDQQQQHHHQQHQTPSNNNRQQPHKQQFSDNTFERTKGENSQMSSSTTATGGVATAPHRGNFHNSNNNNYNHLRIIVNNSPNYNNKGSGYVGQLRSGGGGGGGVSEDDDQKDEDQAAKDDEQRRSRIDGDHDHDQLNAESSRSDNSRVVTEDSLVVIDPSHIQTEERKAPTAIIEGGNEDDDEKVFFDSLMSFGGNRLGGPSSARPSSLYQQHQRTYAMLSHAIHHAATGKGREFSSSK